MREQLIQYVNLLFAGTQDSDDMQQEILQNTLDRYDDLISQGKSPEAAYRLAISGIGDINEILGNDPSPALVASRSEAPEKKDNKKLMHSVAIGIYICCVLPVIALGNVGNGILGVCLMLLLIAAATVLIIMSSDGDEKEEKKVSEAELTPQQKKRKSIEKTLSTIALVLFFVLSFSTGAWHVTWLVFPIIAAVKGIVNACWDLKGANEE